VGAGIVVGADGGELAMGDLPYCTVIPLELHMKIIDKIESDHADEINRMHETLRATIQLVAENHAQSCDLVRNLATMQGAKP